MNFIRGIIQFYKNVFSYENPRFYGIKDKCCADENIFFYCAKEKLFFYKCKTCNRLFFERENVSEFFKPKNSQLPKISPECDI